MRLFCLIAASIVFCGMAAVAEAQPADSSAPAVAPPPSAPAAPPVPVASPALPSAEADKLPKPSELVRFVASGEPGTLTVSAVVNPDCSSIGKTVARVITKPAHGEVSFDYKKVFASFSSRLYEHCTEVEVPGMATIYKSAPDYSGEDMVDVLYIFPNGNAEQVRFVIEVK